MIQKPKCPICCSVLSARINSDAYKCPEHGFISGLQMVLWRGDSPEVFLQKLKESRANG